MDKAVQKRENTLLASMVVSLWAPVATGAAFFLGRSMTQLADFLRRSVEFLALLLSWLVFRYLARQKDSEEAAREKWERIVGLSVAAALGVSGLVMLVLGLLRLRSPNQGGNVLPGLVLAGLGFAVNLYFQRRYSALGREGGSSIIVAQSQLYLAKLAVDTCVIIALGAVALWPGGALAKWVDSLGSVAVACYLLWSSQRSIRGLKSAVGT